MVERDVCELIYATPLECGEVVPYIIPTDYRKGLKVRVVEKRIQKSLNNETVTVKRSSTRNEVLVIDFTGVSLI